MPHLSDYYGTHEHWVRSLGRNVLLAKILKSIEYAGNSEHALLLAKFQTNKLTLVMVPTHESVVSLAMLSLDIDCLILEDWCMVLVFDKKTPENAFNNTTSKRMVGNSMFWLFFA